VCMCACVHVCMCACVHVCMCSCVHVHIYVCACACESESADTHQGLVSQSPTMFIPEDMSFWKVMLAMRARSRHVQLIRQQTHSRSMIVTGVRVRSNTLSARLVAVM